MKKIFTLCLALFSAVATFAQEAKDIFEFVDKDGKTIPSGSVLTVNTIEEDPFGGSAMISSGVYVNQLAGKGEDTYATNLDINLTRLDNGSFESCFPGNCKSVKSTGTFDTPKNFMEDNSLKTEWLPDDKGTATAVITLNAYKAEMKKGGISYTYTKIGECSTITVNFVNDPTGISSIGADGNATVAAYYTVDGKRLTAPQKGLNIARLTNGKTVKVVR